MMISSRSNGSKRGTGWMVSGILIVALCASPGLVFSAEQTAPGPSVGKGNMVRPPSMHAPRTSAAPAKEASATSSKADAPAPAATSPASQDMTKTVQSLSDQISALKKEMAQLKKDGQTASRSTKKHKSAH